MMVEMQVVTVRLADTNKSLIRCLTCKLLELVRTLYGNVARFLHTLC